MKAILQSQVASQFSCLGERCEDTCCQGWSMQVDDATLARYKETTPELLAVVESSADAPWIMKKDPDSGFCVKLEDGLCGIHKKYGSDFLGDACYFYPRATRTLGKQVVMGATLSCPEIVRLMLSAENGATLLSGEVDRLPQNMKDYLPEGVGSADAVAIHEAFLREAIRPDIAVEQAYVRIASVSRSIELIDKKSWAQAVPFYLKNAEGRVPSPEYHEADPFNVLHALCGLVVASKKPPSMRLRKTILDMEQALQATMDWHTVQIHVTNDSLKAFQKIQTAWEEKYSATYQDVLHRYLQMQLSLALYPFAGLGDSLTDRITIIGMRLATIKLALMCSCSIEEGTLPQEVVVRIVQSLSRFMDHLGDATFSMQIYAETGWIQESRMCGVLVAPV